MLSSRAQSSSLSIPAVLGCAHCPQPDPRHGHALCLCLAAAGHTPTVGTQHWPLLPLHFILSLLFNSSFLHSSCLCFSTMGIPSSQLNQPSCSFPSKHQHCHRATFRLTNSQEILPYNLLFIPHVVKSPVLVALLLLQEHFLWFCPFPPFTLHAHWAPHLPLAFFQQLLPLDWSLCVWDLDFDPEQLEYICPLFKASL